MNKTGVAILVLALLVLGSIGWYLASKEEEQPVSASQPPAAMQAPAGLHEGAWPEPAPALVPEQDSPLPPMPEQSVDAVASLEKARLEGDPRAPAVERSPKRDMPTAAELADPDAYQRYEARQNQRVYRAFVQAADNEIPQLQQDIAAARSGGIPPEEIAKGEEKLRRIQAMRDQLMADHPELSAP